MKLVKNLLLSVVSLGIFLGGGELLYRTVGAASARSYFDDQTVNALGWPVPKKAPGEYRIFIFGGSSAYGFPLSDRQSITAWLRKSLGYLLPKKSVRVINCGWPGKASHHVVEGVRDVLRYQPDLYVIYSGHNDATTVNRLYLDNAMYSLGLKLRHRSAFSRYLAKRITRLRKKLVYGKSGFLERRYREEVIAEKVYQKLDVDEETYRRILARYRRNMEEVIRVAKKNRVEILFVNLPSNLRDVPPRFSTHRTGVSPDELEVWEENFAEGERLRSAGQDREAIASYEKAAAIDPEYAQLHYSLGMAYEKAGDYERAKDAFTRARDLDRHPWRAKSSLNETIEALARERGALFVDLVEAFGRLSPHGIIGESMIYDDVHPTLEGQQLIAQEILRKLSESGKVAPKEEWQWKSWDTAWEKERMNREDKGEWTVKGYRFVLQGLRFWDDRRYREVVQNLEKGLELIPEFVESYAFIGDAYWHLGESRKAAKAFEAFVLKDATLFHSILETYPDIQASYRQLMQTEPSGSFLKKSPLA